MNNETFQIPSPTSSLATLSLGRKWPMTEVTEEIEVKSSFTFFSLPREIRDQIYTLIFKFSSPIYPSRSRAGISPFLSLLRANRQIYNEAVAVLYGSNIFQIRGTPSWMAVDFLYLLIMQCRESYTISPCFFCQARFHLRRLYIPSHGINLKILKHIFSLLKYFPNLEYLKVVFLGAFGLSYKDVVNICRLLGDRRKLMGEQGCKLVLLKRFNWAQAEDISWMVNERPCKHWNQIGSAHEWRTETGEVRFAKVVDVPQDTSE